MKNLVLLFSIVIVSSCNEHKSGLELEKNNKYESLNAPLKINHKLSDSRYLEIGFASDTSLVYIKNYNEDLRYNEILRFHENGKLASKKEYTLNEDINNGLAYFFFQNGFLSQERLFYTDTLKQHGRDYYPDGALKSKVYYTLEGEAFFRVNFDEYGKMLNTEGTKPKGLDLRLVR